MFNHIQKRSLLDMNFFSHLFGKKTTNEDTSMKYLIVGLGNIGAEYEGTRHNCGFMVLDRLLKSCASEKSEKPTYVLDRHAYRAEVKWKGRTLILIRPTTYMNLSGKAVQYWMQKEKISLENLLVVVDDIALPVGKMRMKKQGSGGGHNGLANIEELLHTSNYCRLRIGIGNNFGQGHQIDYVLGPFSGEEQAQIDPLLDRAVEAVKAFATLGPDRAMNIYN
jgi:PTH1 family peptidyl-tRNA hydrolase